MSCTGWLQSHLPAFARVAGRMHSSGCHVRSGRKGTLCRADTACAAYRPSISIPTHSEETLLSAELRLPRRGACTRNSCCAGTHAAPGPHRGRAAAAAQNVTRSRQFIFSLAISPSQAATAPTTGQQWPAGRPPPATRKDAVMLPVAIKPESADMPAAKPQRSKKRPLPAGAKAPGPQKAVQQEPADAARTLVRALPAALPALVRAPPAALPAARTPAAHPRLAVRQRKRSQPQPWPDAVGIGAAGTADAVPGEAFRAAARSQPKPAAAQPAA